MNAAIDLRELARRPAEGSPPPNPPRRLVTRYVLPGLLLCGFMALGAWAGRDWLLPARPVTVAPVMVMRSGAQPAGAELFTAAGWIEPRPTPVNVTALAEGVIEKLMVVEGQAVAADEPVATLIDADARLDLAAAEADLRLRQAELKRAEAALAAAESHLQNPVALQAELAAAEAALAVAETALANLPFEIDAAAAEAGFARQALAGRSEAGQAVSARALQRTQSELAAAEAQHKQLVARQPKLAQQVDALARQQRALARRLELKIDETHAAAAAASEVQAAQARTSQAETGLAVARLQLDRMVVRSPVAGRVLELVGHPGRRVMGLSSGGLHDASTVVTLFDPALLQVRADVRLENVPGVQAGQEVRIETDAWDAPLQGVVLYATSAADIQKNTLQIKAAIIAPPEVLKPEMLVRVTFLAPPTEATQDTTTALRCFVPRELVETDTSGSYVWVAEHAADGWLARRRPISLGQAGDAQLTEAASGLRPADRLVVQGRAGLTEGERLQVTEEDAGLGTGSIAPPPTAGQPPAHTAHPGSP